MPLPTPGAASRPAVRGHTDQATANQVIPSWVKRNCVKPSWDKRGSRQTGEHLARLLDEIVPAHDTINPERQQSELTEIVDGLAVDHGGQVAGESAAHQAASPIDPVVDQGERSVLDR